MSEWISIEDSIPEYKDDGVIVHFENGSIESVHLEFFREITAGIDENGNQLYTRYHLHHNPKATHWMPLPNPPELKK